MLYGKWGTWSYHTWHDKHKKLEQISVPTSSRDLSELAPVLRGFAYFCPLQELRAKQGWFSVPYYMVLIPGLRRSLKTPQKRAKKIPNDFISGLRRSLETPEIRTQIFLITVGLRTAHFLGSVHLRTVWLLLLLFDIRTEWCDIMCVRVFTAVFTVFSTRRHAASSTPRVRAGSAHLPVCT